MSDLERVQRQLIQGLEGKLSFAFGYHPDADGIDSTAILIKYLRQRAEGLEEVRLFTIDNTGRTFEPPQLEGVMGMEAVGWIDLSVRSAEQISEVRETGKYVFMIDHHGIYTWKEGNISKSMADYPDLFINSESLDILGRSASELMQQLVGTQEKEWLDKIGLCGDLIQGDYTPATKKIAEIINLTGLAGRNLEPITKKDQFCERIVDYLLKSTKAEEVLDYLEQDEGITTRYHTISMLIDRIRTDIVKIENGRPSVEDYLVRTFKRGPHKIIEVGLPEQKYDIKEQLLKSHHPSLGENTTMIVHTPFEGETKVAVYTSVPDVVDCEPVCIKNGGGGHHSRGGLTLPTTDPQAVHKVTESVLACYD